MKTKNEIKKRYLRALDYLLSDKCVAVTGIAIKTFHTARELYWVLGGEGDFPIKMFPNKEIIDKEQLYSVIDWAK